jgi:hypothetical protein
MPSSGLFRRMALVRADVSEERIASTIRLTRLCELLKTSAVTRNRSTLRKGKSLHILIALMTEAIRSSETSALTRAARRNILEEGVLHSYRREALKSYRNSLDFKAA